MRSTTRLTLETLGERTLPSVSISFPAAPLVPILQYHLLRLNGTVHGDYSVQALTPDTGTTYQFNASTKLRHLGTVSISGSISTTGNILHGHATGQLTISGSQGEAVLELTGPLQKGGTPIPGYFTFKVINSSGDYAGQKIKVL